MKKMRFDVYTSKVFQEVLKLALNNMFDIFLYGKSLLGLLIY